MDTYSIYLKRGSATGIKHVKAIAYCDANMVVKP